MKTLVILALFAAVALFAWFSLPPAPRPIGEAASGHANHGGDPATLVDGVVVALDRPAGNITLSHGALAHLGMPAMTMGFRVGDPALLEAVKPGDKVKFRADVVGGAFTVLNMERSN
jgi:Cu(I)/Ag(I) efflux system periplasmic protein CusF